MACLHVTHSLVPLLACLRELTWGQYRFPKIRREESLQKFMQRRACSWVKKNQKHEEQTKQPCQCSSGLLVGFTLLLSYFSLPHAQHQSYCSRIVYWFCGALCCRQGSPEDVGAFRQTGMQRSKVEEEGSPQQNHVWPANPDFTSRF